MPGLFGLLGILIFFLSNEKLKNYEYLRPFLGGVGSAGADGGTGVF
jgi:hypothetical protein